MDGTESEAEPQGFLGGWSDGALIGTGLAVSWLLFFLWPLQLLVEIPLAVQYMSRKAPLRFLPLWINFTTVVLIGTVLFTVTGYFAGTAKCWGGGNDQTEIGDFSPRYRCQYWWFPGDVFMPWTLVIGIPNRLAIEGCVALFGPVKQTYQGPLPTLQDVKGWIASPTCQRVPMARFKSGRFQVSDTAMRLTPDTAFTALRYTEFRNPLPPNAIDAENAAEVRVALFQGQCLAVMAQQTTSYGQMGCVSDWIITLIDVAQGSIITQDVYNDLSHLR